ncbi:MAG TPA: hemerythrin domain-containing protein [Solirubrobacter sp.]|jgi:hemerythrin-like domain-containing protein|nr:hemerythrin domain-containing protein [Solirubrobacter sp.]
MKRSEELAPLSRDHHQGLFAALKLRRGAPDARDVFLRFWVDGRRHFAIEEELLLPALARHIAADHESIVRVLVEHVQLRRLAADAEAGAPAEMLTALGDLLHAHIRHEEDVLFPLAERELPADELASLGAAIAAAEDSEH